MAVRHRIRFPLARLGIALALGIGLVHVCRSADAFCRTRTCDECPLDDFSCPAEGLPLAWHERCVSYSVQYESVPTISHGDLRAATAAAFQAWQEASCPDGGGRPSMTVGDPFGAAVCERVEYNENQANANIVVLRATWDDDASSNALALTTVSFDTNTGRIYDADIEVNATLPISSAPVVPHDQFDLQSIITHEAGHFLGLAHSTKGVRENCRNGATMCPASPPGRDEFRTLDEDDIAGICTIYPPNREAPACDMAPRRGFSPDCGLDPVDGGSCSLVFVPHGRSSRPSWLLALVLGLGAARLHRTKRLLLAANLGSTFLAASAKEKNRQSANGAQHEVKV